MAELDKDRAVALLNRILEAELAGVVRYTHYSFLVFGHNRIPIVSWLREQATESLTHAQQAGEMITLLGAYPSLAIGPLLDSHQTDIAAVMNQAASGVLNFRGAQLNGGTADVQLAANNVVQFDITGLQYVLQ